MYIVPLDSGACFNLALAGVVLKSRCSLDSHVKPMSFVQRGLSQIQSSADKWYEQLSGASKPGFVKHTSVRESRTLRKSQL
jgi:hypothetical protein